MASTAQRHMAGISVADTTEASNEFEPFFGKPANGPIITDPYRKQSNQNYALPDAYKGQSSYLGEMVNLQILTDVTWYTGVILPIVRTEQMAISWNKWEFNQHRTEIVPEETPSRLISSQMSSESAAFVRSGIAFQLEHGFMKTERGRENYRYGLRQIAVAVNETNNADVIIALITCENANMTWEKRHGHYGSRSINQRLEDEVENWACCQKDEHGFAKLDNQIDENMMRYQGRADTWIVAPPMMVFAAFTKHSTEYYLSGKTWSPDAVTSYGLFGRNRVFVMRQYDISNADMIDLSLRERQIGSYLTMMDRNRNARNDSDFSSITEELSIVCYNEDKDDWYKFLPLQAIQRCELFNEDGSLRGIKVSWNVPHYAEDVKHDFLLMKNEHDPNKRIPVEVFGQIREKYLTTPSLANIARSVVHASKLDQKDIQTLSDKIITGKNATKTKIAYADLVNLIEVAQRASIDTDTMDKRYLHLPIPNNEYHPLTDLGKAKMPIQNSDELKRLIEALSVLLPGSVFTEGNWASPTLGLDGGLSNAVVIQNLLGLSGIHVWARETPAVTDDFAIAEKDRTNMTIIQGLPSLAKNLSGEDATKDAVFMKVLADLFNLVVAGGKLDTYRAANDTTYEPHFIYIDTAKGNTPTLNIETASAFVLRTKLIDLVQQIIVRTLTKENNKGFKSTNDRLKALLEKLQRGNDSAANAGDPVEVWDRLKDAKEFPEVLDHAGSRAEIEAAKGKMTATKLVAGNFGVADAQVKKSFLITPLVLSITQTADLLKDMIALATGANEKEREDKITKLQFTISNPKKLNEPLTTLTQLENLLNDITTNSQSYEKFNVKASDVTSLPLIAELKKARLVNGGVHKGLKRKGAPVAAKKFTNYKRVTQMRQGGRYRGDDDDDDDAMDIDQHLDELDEAAAEADVLRGTSDAFLPDLLSKRFIQRIRAIDNQHVNPVYKLVAKILAATPVRRQILENMVNNNIILPMGFLIPRPHQRYRMHFAIKLLAGSETGNTYMGHSDFIVGDDVRVKMHYGHYTVYTKAVVREPKNVYVAYDVFSARALGGAGVRPINPATYDPRSQKYGDGDVFFLAIPYERTSLPNPLDLSGHFSYYEDIANNDSNQDREPHYETAVRYNSMYGWRRADDVGKFQVEQVHHPYIVDPERQAINYNTVCFHDEERYFDRHTRQHVLRHTNTGHWGNYCYPGVRKLRNGRPNAWEKPNHIAQ